MIKKIMKSVGRWRPHETERLQPTIYYAGDSQHTQHVQISKVIYWDLTLFLGRQSELT